MPVRERAKRLTLRVRRWKRLLRSLDLQISSDTELEPTGDRDFLVCGLPRSGTSLLAAALYQPPSCVTVMEPWDGLRVPPAELMRSLRGEIRGGMLRRGRLDVTTLLRTGKVRWGRDGGHPHAIEVASEFALGVKWPTYWQYLGLLSRTRFLVCVRDPLEVVSSFERTGGRLAQGLDYDVAFNRAMNDELLTRTDDPAIRRALLYEHIAARIGSHARDPNVFVVRYERWFTERIALMAEIGDFLDVELGPGPAEIRRPRSLGGDPDTVALVREHCPSGRLLGYDGAHADRS